VVRQDRDWNPSAAEKEAYSLVVTVADRDNEHAQLYTQMQALLAEQAVVREQQQARLEAARVQYRR
jgi:mannitol/fructose-specific phosphotransferase system IIA component